jgi:hypothetical protein
MTTKPETTALAPLASYPELRELAKDAHTSRFFPGAATPSAAFIIMATGQELGLSPMQSMRGIHIVEGKPVLSADMIGALCKKSPLCKYFRQLESTVERAVFETWRAGDPEATRGVFTIEDARRAELAGRNTWKRYPAAMLRARCVSALARTVYPDLLLGVYCDDEGEDIRQSAHREHAPPLAPVRVIEAEVEEEPAPVDPELLERLAFGLTEAKTDEELRAAWSPVKAARRLLSEDQYQKLVDFGTRRRDEIKKAQLPQLDQEQIAEAITHLEIEIHEAGNHEALKACADKIDALLKQGLTRSQGLYLASVVTRRAQEIAPTVAAPEPPQEVQP